MQGGGDRDEAVGKKLKRRSATRDANASLGSLTSCNSERNRVPHERRDGDESYGANRERGAHHERGNDQRARAVSVTQLRKGGGGQRLCRAEAFQKGRGCVLKGRQGIVFLCGSRGQVRVRGTALSYLSLLDQYVGLPAQLDQFDVVGVGIPELVLGIR